MLLKFVKNITCPWRNLIYDLCHQGMDIIRYDYDCRHKNKSKFLPIRQFKGIHNGKRCFIVATGPSLTIEDVEKLKNEICWTMNTGCYLIDKADFRPSYYAIADGNAYRRVKDDLARMNLSHVFYNDKDINWQIDSVNAYPLPIWVSLYINQWERRHIPLCLRKKKMSLDPSKRIYQGGNVVNVILQLCFYMGFKEIYLLGTDCNYFGNQQYSSAVDYKQYEQLYQTPEYVYETMINDYKCAKVVAERLGVKIYNVSRGGMLEVFERLDLENVLGLK